MGSLRMLSTALILVAGGGTGWAEAQDGAARADAGVRYAAKVLCTTGFPDGPEAAEPFAAAGIYATAVNVLNPTAGAAAFEYRVSAPGAPLSRPVTAQLGPEETLAIDCRGLPTLFCPVDNLCFDFAFLDGFLIIASPVELDVVVVYSARTAAGEVETLDVEAVAPRWRGGE